MAGGKYSRAVKGFWNYLTKPNYGTSSKKGRSTTKSKKVSKKVYGANQAVKNYRFKVAKTINSKKAGTSTTGKSSTKSKKKQSNKGGINSSEQNRESASLSSSVTFH